MEQTALVLEGGGLRAMYTAGVLDSFMAAGLTFPYLVGVSAGAIYPASYLSRQAGRNLQIQQGFLNDKRYMGLSHWLRRGNYINVDFAYRRMANELIPFDFENFLNSGSEFKVGAFNCVTGNTEFFGMADFHDHQRLLDVLIASSSLPFISHPMLINDIPYLDGGIADAIPIKQAQADGFSKQLVILTQDAAYRKSPFKPTWLAKWVYRDYPEVAKALMVRHQRYNQALQQLQQALQAGTALVIQPKAPLGLSRLERNIDKVAAVYHLGRSDGAAQLPRVQAFLQSAD
ncbi:MULTISPECIES: patatin-like phospholipase family protein [Shewanella]|jgi:predicted patatin/cPLA2 family phospholipase|uniref:patatin-like phospholipase family protein n=1 Tax=Shewanella TaxID=22 RepID=UPI00167872D0|nr:MULTISPECIES: patatin family protein [Shewanella]MBO1272200.1 patatin family protein [Shewanella sp. 4t3-1-2LB]MCL2906140.1 patatin family protein [Shewanella fodinae]GGY98720.1 patatin family protein [Shewanella fodinae]